MKIIDKLPRSIEKSSRTDDGRLKALHGQHQMLIDQRRRIENLLITRPVTPESPKTFLNAYQAGRADGNHLQAVQKVDDAAASAAESWLLSVAAGPCAEMKKLFDSASLK